MKHLNKHTSKILKLGVAGILFFSSFTFIEAKNPEPIKAKTPISNTSVMKAPQNLSSNFFQSLKTAISKIQPTKALTTTSSETAGSFTVEGDTTGYSYTESDQGNFVLTFSKSENYKITGDGKEVTNQTIAIGSDFEGTITLENVNITSKVASPFFVDKTAKLTIDLKGKNKLNTTNQKNATIDFSNATGDAHLTITSNEDGSLDCNNEGPSAAIGGGNGLSGNNITIAGGKITVSSFSGAGIGGGSNGPGSNITINGGTVTATGVNGGAGIGGGKDGSGNDIIINRGTVTAIGENLGAGIGGGDDGSGSNITINGGTVIATASNNAAGIGGSGKGSGSYITIGGGTVTATGGSMGAGIGGGAVGTGSDITISGGTVTATGGEAGTDIGAGYGSLGTSKKIIISNGSVKANSIDGVPTDGTNNVYLAKIEDQLDINEVLVDGKPYIRNGNHYDKNFNTYSDGTFYLYLEGGKNHTIVSKKSLCRAIWDAVSEKFTIEGANAGDFMVFDKDNQVAESGFDYDGKNKVLKMTDTSENSTYRIQGIGETEERIEVASNYNGTIVIEDVNITSTGVSPFFVNNTAKLTIDLKGKNILSLDSSNIEEPTNAIIDFSDASGDANLTITSSSNDGSLVCDNLKETAAAAIGGKEHSAGNNITIAGGEITIGSNNLWYGAGIGGGNRGGANNINITGGTVTATSVSGASIGSGYYAKASNISISGGTISATSESGAGIGSGSGSTAKNINISGGTVNATSKLGAGIGKGYNSSGNSENIIISNGSVNASSIDIVPTNGTNEVYPVKLVDQLDINKVSVDGKEYTRNGNHFDRDSNTYSDGTFYLYLKGGKNHTIVSNGNIYTAIWDVNTKQFTVKGTNAGDFIVLDKDDNISENGFTYNTKDNILSFNQSGDYTVIGNPNIISKEVIKVADKFVGSITIDNVNIDVSDQQRITAFKVNNTAQLTLKLKNTNILKSGGNTAGLEFCNADVTTGGNLVITSKEGEGKTSGNLHATGGEFGAGIGGGSSGSGSYITITGGTITAIGGDYGAGIGGGSMSSGNNITITGGTVSTTGGVNGAGIGSGSDQGSGKDITITGGTVIATGGLHGAGIGGGAHVSGSNITITGGTVIATGGYLGGAGIGGGSSGSGNDITIAGGIVTTIGGEKGAGIGGGYGDSGNDITIKGGTVTAIGGEEGGTDIGGGYYSSDASENIIIYNGSVKANSFGTDPIDDKKNNVYLAKLEGQSGINKVLVDGNEYKRNGNHYDEDTKDYTDGAFYLYLTGEKNHTIVSEGKRYKAIWNGNDSTFTVKLIAETPEFDTSVTLDSVIVNVTNSDVDTYGKLQYQLMDKDGKVQQNWQDSNEFNQLKSGTKYTVNVKYAGNETYYSEIASKDVSTTEGSWNISIPSKATAGGDAIGISVSDLALGYNESVIVKVNSGLDESGKLTLNRSDNTSTILSQMMIGDNDVTSQTPIVATFNKYNNLPVSIKFAQPMKSNILAGNYTGTVNFLIEKSN